ncbi:histone methylation protein DOT1 [Aureococcus anophagefferens]|nr:histone methylation protein DOT1 [Aureococcus anophagefferens]
MEVKWYFLRDPDVRRELRAMYDAGAGKAGLEEHDCAYRIHVRAAATGRGGPAGVIGNGSYACLARSILRADPGAKICVYSEDTSATLASSAPSTASRSTSAATPTRRSTTLSPRSTSSSPTAC